MASAEVAVPPNAVKEKEKKPRVPKGSKPPPSHPTYLQMIIEAITSLKERGGSSHYAIGHYIDAKYKTQLPANYKKLLTGQLRKLAKSGKLTRVKGSFKVPVELSKAPKLKKPKTVKAAPAKKPSFATPKPKPKPKPKAKKVVAKPKPVAKAPTEAVKAPKVPKKAPVAAVKKAEKPPAKKAKVASPKKPVAPAKKAAKPVEKKTAAPKAVKKTPKKAAKKTPKKAPKK